MQDMFTTFAIGMILVGSFCGGCLIGQKITEWFNR
jgi:hypothetical protein